MATAFIQSLRVVHFVYSIPSHIHSFGEHAGNCFADRIITTRWKEMLSFGVVLAVASAVTAFFYNAFFLGVSFLVLGALHAVNTIRLHHYAVLQGLERTVTELQNDGQRLSTHVQTLGEQVEVQTQLADNLRRTNTDLEATVVQMQIETEAQKLANQQSRENIARMEQANASLRQTNASLGEQVSGLNKTKLSLEHQVDALSKTKLSLEQQVIFLTERNSELRQSAQWIRDEISRLGVQNTTLGKNITLFDQRLLASGVLYGEVLKNLDAYKTKLKDQADGVKKFLDELFDKNLLKEDILVQKMVHLDIVHKNLEQAVTKLQTTEVQCAEKNTQLALVSQRLKETEDELRKLLPQLQEVQQGLEASNRTHAQGVAQLAKQVTRLELLSPDRQTDRPSCNLTPSPSKWTLLEGSKDEIIWRSTVQVISEEAIK